MKRTRFSPTKFTMKFCRDRGCIARVVERWIPVVNLRKDLLGFDILVIAGTDAIGVQCGISAHFSEKVKKAIADPEVKTWLQTRNKFLVWTWAKRAVYRKNGVRAKRDQYAPRITELRLIDGEVRASEFVLL